MQQRMLFLQETSELLRRHGSAEVITLNFVAAVLAQKLGLLPALDPFRDDFEPQRPRHAEDGAGDGRVIRIVRQASLSRGKRFR
jgi:hypothetical protein